MKKSLQTEQWRFSIDASVTVLTRRPLCTSLGRKRVRYRCDKTIKYTPLESPGRKQTLFLTMIQISFFHLNEEACRKEIEIFYSRVPLASRCRKASLCCCCSPRATYWAPYYGKRERGNSSFAWIASFSSCAHEFIHGPRERCRISTAGYPPFAQEGS